MIRELLSVEFKGEIINDQDISAIASFGDFLALGSDENQCKVQILQKTDAAYQVRDQLEIELPVQDIHDEQEIDIEGMAINDNHTLFIIGSHSLKRSKVKPDKTYQQNRRRITKVIAEERKNSIFKLQLDPQTGKEQKQVKGEVMQIKEIIEQDPVLGRFTTIPSKENGIDIEGIAADGSILYLGFRAPVLRLNYVPVMVILDQETLEYELRFVDLGGNGIRDITKVKDGFLIIAGSLGDGFSPYQLYFWNGIDCIPGTGKPQASQLTLLGTIPTPDGAKAEGITVLSETSSVYQVIIVYDGLPKGAPKLLEVIKAGLSMSNEQ